MAARYRLRQWTGVALVPAAAFAVHQLRYLLAFGSDAGRELTHQGHGYLHDLTPWIVVACGLALGGFLTRLARAWRTGRGEPAAGRGFVSLWLVASVGLVAIYAGQEFLEGLFASGHSYGLAGIFGDGGLSALPAALAVGLVLALVVRGARRAVALAAARRSKPRILPAPPARARPLVVRARRRGPLALSAAGRAPPGATAPTLV